MAESSEVQALEKISTEVGESQIKITLSSQCIKAQAFLVDKLRKQTERQKEICNFVSGSNLKLQAEIKQAELEIKSLITAHETIKSSNVELKKELLLAKERKLEIKERITSGEKKYEDLWTQSKQRYESIPFVQKLLAATNKTQIIKDNIIALENQSQRLMKEYQAKKELVAKLDRDRIVQLAEYLVHELPNSVRIIQEKSTAINKMSSEIEEILKDHDTALLKPNIPIPTKQKELVIEENRREKPVDDSWVNIYPNNERDLLMMPRLQFINSDFDVISAKLDEIKIKKVEVQHSVSGKRVDPIELVSEISSKRIKKDDEFSIFFNNRIENTESENKGGNFSRKKLINILDDVKLDQTDAYNIVSKVQFDKLKEVDIIGKDVIKDSAMDPEILNEKNAEIIEEIDLTKNKSDSILIPPTQFLDFTQENIFNNSQQQVEVIVHMSDQSSGKLSQSLKNSQESVNKKRVSFDLPLSIQEMSNQIYEDDLKEKQTEESGPNETIDSQINISLASDESYSKIKDMIMKKHNLDLSPQFVYAKNKIMQMNNDERIVTSKFFQPNKATICENDENKIEEGKDKAKSTQECDNQENPNKQDEKTNEDLENVIEVDDVIVSSPKPNKITSKERLVTGLLFNHGTQGIPDSLNVSISTTGFEEGDADFPHCIDSSLLLSPKADVPMSMGGDDVDVASQEVPNFLSGLRKAGLSFFGQSATGSKPDTSGQTHGNNFNFNFGGDEKKTRGGLFSMFH